MQTNLNLSGVMWDRLQPVSRPKAGPDTRLVGSAQDRLKSGPTVARSHLAEATLNRPSACPVVTVIYCCGSMWTTSEL